MRRMSNSTDGKITFREFSVAITPELSGLNTEATAGIEFNTEKKQATQSSEKEKTRHDTDDASEKKTNTVTKKAAASVSADPLKKTMASVTKAEQKSLKFSVQ